MPEQVLMAGGQDPCAIPFRGLELPLCPRKRFFRDRAGGRLGVDVHRQEPELFRQPFVALPFTVEREVPRQDQNVRRLYDNLVCESV